MPLPGPWALGLLALLALVSLVATARALATERGAPGPPAPPTPKDAQGSDLSGVSVAPERQWVRRILESIPEGRYQHPRLIGQGGTGVVFRVEDAVHDRPMALKMLTPELAARADARRRFVRGARALASLDHPTIPRIKRISGDPLPYLIREFVEGRNLHRVVDEDGPPAPEVLRGWLVQAAAALAAAHAQGVVHRDVKPSNLLLDQEGQLHLIDFDLALQGGQSRVTVEGEGAGTLEYRPPEQLRGDEPDPRSDVFSLAVTGYTLWTGRFPFPLPALFRAEPCSPRELPDDDPLLAQVLRAGLQIPIEERPESMEAWIAPLR